MSKTRGNPFSPTWIWQRELGTRLPLGHSDMFYKRLYSSISRCHSWDGKETSESEHGRINNLEFSTDGTFLVAGCQKKSFLMFDPLSRRLIRTVHKAHSSSITKIKFLDSRIFATGCFDGTVSLWDSRNLKSRCQTLLGHSSMIGNIEFSHKNDSLITSGLEGCTFIWDMKNWNERGEFRKETLETHPVIRLRLNPDETKMILSSAFGCLVIVHDLDLDKIAQDLKELEKTIVNPFTFEAISTSGSRILTRNRRRNRVELVGNLPNPSSLYVFSALEIHPHGWSVFSRKMQTDSRPCSMADRRVRDWTCVHDIQDKGPSEGEATLRRESIRDSRLCPQQIERIHEECTGFCERIYSSPEDTAWATSHPPGPSSAPRLLQGPASPGSNPSSSRVQDCSLPPNASVGQMSSFSRLTHYIDEPFLRNGNHLSLSVSADGRVVCSPLNCRIRLLAFSPECSEQSVSLCGTYPRRLHELRTRDSQNEDVLYTKFSPRDCLLVCGCLDGKLAWYQPVV